MCRFLIIYADVIFAKRQKKLRLSGMIYRFLIICTDRAFAKRQKKLRLSGMIYRFLIICTDRVFAKKAKETSIIGESFQSIRAAGAPLLFDLLSYLFSQKSRPKAAFFILCIPLNSSFHRQAR